MVLTVVTIEILRVDKFGGARRKRAYEAFTRIIMLEIVRVCFLRGMIAFSTHSASEPTISGMFSIVVLYEIAFSGESLIALSTVEFRIAVDFTILSFLLLR